MFHSFHIGHISRNASLTSTPSTTLWASPRRARSAASFTTKLPGTLTQLTTGRITTSQPRHPRRPRRTTTFTATTTTSTTASTPATTTSTLNNLASRPLPVLRPPSLAHFYGRFPLHSPLASASPSTRPGPAISAAISCGSRARSAPRPCHRFLGATRIYEPWALNNHILPTCSYTHCPPPLHWGFTLHGQCQGKHSLRALAPANTQHHASSAVPGQHSHSPSCTLLKHSEGKQSNLATTV